MGDFDIVECWALPGIWSDGWRASAAAIRAGTQDIATLQAYMQALEGDVPKEIFRAVRQTEADLDHIRFAIDEADERDGLEKVLQELEGVLLSCGAI